MTAVPKRDAVDWRVSKVVSDLLGRQYKDVVRMMGDPPSVNNFPDDYWNKVGISMTPYLAEEIEKVYVAQAEALIADKPLSVSWDTINKRAQKWAEEYTYKEVMDITTSSRLLLEDSISRYFSEGWTRGELERAIFDQYGPVRAEMIAVTEVTRAAARGEDAIWDELAAQGIEMITTWSTLYDELVCDICGSLDGKPADGRDSAGPYWFYEGDQIYCPAHPRCRCNENNELPKATEKELEKNALGLEDPEIWQDRYALIDYINAHATDLGEMQLKQVDGKEFFKQIQHRGRTIQYARGTADAVAKDVRYWEDFLAKGGKLPGNFEKNVKNIYYSGLRNKADTYWGKKYGIPNFRSLACCGGQNPAITVFNGNALGDSIFHEMGHNMAYQLWYSSNPPSRSVYAKLFRAFKKGTATEFPVSEYAQVSVAEDFAEAVEWYITKPGLLKAYHPKRFAYIKKYIEEIIP